MPQSFRHGFELGITNHLSLGPAIAFQMKHGATYTLLGVRKIDGQDRAEFRMRMASGGVNYNEWVLTHGPEGKVVATDIFSVNNGGLISTTTRRAMLLFLAKAQPTLWQRLTGQESAILTHIELFKKSQHLLLIGRFKAFLAERKKIPASLRHSKLFLLEKVEAIDALYAANNVKYAGRFCAAVLTYQRAFPDDPAAIIMDVDYLYSTHQFAKEAKANIQISESLGGDPYQVMLAAVVEEKLEPPWLWPRRKNTRIKPLKHRPPISMPIGSIFRSALNATTSNKSRAVCWRPERYSICI